MNGGPTVKKVGLIFYWEEYDANRLIDTIIWIQVQSIIVAVQRISCADR